MRFQDTEEDELSDTDIDIQEEPVKQYDEHYWCKEREIPVGFTFKSKRQVFIKACENIKSNFNKNSIFSKETSKESENLTFHVLDRRNKENGPEMDIDVDVSKKIKERGVAVLKCYGPNSKTGEYTLMVTKSKRHNAKFVKILALDIIKKMIDMFITGEGWGSIFKKERKQMFLCSICEKSFVSENNLNVHTRKFHVNKENNCDINKTMKKDNGNSKLHKSHTHEKEKYNCNVSQVTIKDKNKLKEHNKNHVKKESNCQMSDSKIKGKNEKKEHLVDNHTNTNELNIEPEYMEVDDESDDERLKRSEMQDKKVLEKQRKQDEKEDQIRLHKLSVEQKKKEEEKERIEGERLERKKRKASIKQQKKIMKRKLDKFPSNISELPENVKHLVDEGDLQLQIPPDGACAPSAGAAHFFKDPKYGPHLRMLMNNHVYERWDYYKEKFSFPLVRKIGVRGDSVKFEDGEEEKFRQFLRTERSAFLWSDSQDLHIMSNLYQMRIKVITTKGPQDSHPTVNWIGPAPELTAYKLLREGAVPDMKLLHYDELHYNLIISKDDEIAKFGSLSQWLGIGENENSVEEHVKEQNENSEEKTVTESYEMRHEIMENKDKKIKDLEKELKEKTKELKEVIETLENINEFEPVKNRKRGPQVESLKNMQNEYNCRICSTLLESQENFNIHMKNHKEKENQLLKELKASQTSKTKIENEYFSCEKELRIKTEELEKLKIENKDLRTIIELKKQLKQRADDDMNMEVEEEDTAFIGCQSESTSESKNDKIEGDICCPYCDFKGRGKRQIRKHMNIKHSHKVSDVDKSKNSEEEFNCMDCPFQATNEKQLRNHMDIKHMIKCRICERVFKEKRDLMFHRKREHVNMVALCRKFSENSCPYLEESCFWIHSDKSLSEENTKACFNCGKSFKSKRELMIHRKKEHIDTVRECENFKEGRCVFMEDFCWFKHSRNIMNDNISFEALSKNAEFEPNESVFHRAQERLKPPLRKEN